MRSRGHNLECVNDVTGMSWRFEFQLAEREGGDKIGDKNNSMYGDGKLGRYVNIVGVSGGMMVMVMMMVMDGGETYSEVTADDDGVRLPGQHVHVIDPHDVDLVVHVHTLDVLPVPLDHIDQVVHTAVVSEQDLERKTPQNEYAHENRFKTPFATADCSVPRTSALWILYSCRIWKQSFSSMWVRGPVLLKEMPPVFLRLK